MRSDQVVRTQLLALLRGGNAHMSFDQAVADFPPEQFNTRPPNVSYTCPTGRGLALYCEWCGRLGALARMVGVERP